MSLSQALAAAVSGLRANQVGMSLVAGNVANANTPGYVRKTINQASSPIGENTAGVRVTAVQRQLNDYVLRQLRGETSGANYADIRSQFYQRLQQIYGQPGSDSSISAIFNNFSTALQALTASPEDFSARTAVISAGQLLAQNLNVMSAGVQSLRSNAENGIASAVSDANLAMQQIADINQQLAGASLNSGVAANLLDQRDSAINRLSQLLDITVVPGEGNTVTVTTSSGMQLVGLKASILSFEPNGTITPEAQWSADPSKNGVGSLLLSTPNGSSIDLVRTRSIRSGQIAGLLQLRDQDLVEAQNQLDAVAAAMASALSDKTTSGSAVTSGAQSGFDVDIGGLLAGNTITITYRDGTNTLRSINLVRVDDPSLLPLPESTGAAKTVGVNLSGGMANAVSQIAAALSSASSNIQASTTGGTMLRLLDDGAGSLVRINSVTATATATTFNSGSGQLPFFLDGGTAYTGAYHTLGNQSVGLAGRINVNAALIADPSNLVAYQGGVSPGDTTRPDFIYQQIVNATLSFKPNSGIGLAASPYTGTLGSFLNQVISRQGEAAANADALSQGQDVVLNSLQERFAEDAGINIDQEMTTLLNLQNSYAANARVMSVIQEMMDMLMRM
jgi:flagellar hook-associated protein 1 FlgK